MSSPLQQMQIAYDPLQDRLVFTIFTQDFCEYRFWITRHILKGIWNGMMQLLQADQKNQLKLKEESKKAAEQIQKEKAQRQPGAEKFATSATRRPLGDEPLLLAKFFAKPMERNTFLVHLEDARGVSIEFNGESSIIVAFCQLILQAVSRSDWNLDLKTATDK